MIVQDIREFQSNVPFYIECQICCYNS